MARCEDAVPLVESPAPGRPGGGAATTFLLALALTTGATAGSEGGSRGDYPIRPVPFTAVTVADGFWSPRLDTNRKVTIRYDFQKCEQKGRIANFARAAGLEEGAFEGLYGFDDSDVYKVIEGASYALSLHPDRDLKEYIDGVAAKIAAAQEEDGYLYTVGTIGKLVEKPNCCVSYSRWSDMKSGHELYNAGHFYEAAVAHYQATGERTLLDVAIKNADLLTRVFGPGRNMEVPGHEEVEIGLVKLYRTTGDERYLSLARFFLDQRGNAKGHELYGAYNQDHMPVVEQTEAVGHAVRAGYMYAGMADVGALTGDRRYVDAIDRIWENVIGKKQYLTGGVGSRHRGESFGDNYELPNLTAYTETCAAIANALWNERLFLLHGDAKYLDVLERVIYNGFLSGVALDGKHFFYSNPLASDGHFEFNQGALGRKEWFDCSCCPTNDVRFMPSIAGYIYAQRARDLFVNLFVAGSADMTVEGTKVKVRQDTRYPWDGRVKITLEPERPEALSLHVRIPGWAQGHPVPSDLYEYMDDGEKAFALTVNGEPAKVEMSQGFAVMQRTWKAGDTVELSLPMEVRRVRSNDKVKADAGRVALERGPVVYCAEAVDNGGRVLNLVLPDDASLQASHRADLLGGVTVIEGQALALHPAEDGRSVVTRKQPFVAVPYHAWGHRGNGEMAVWLPRRVQLDFRAP
jgi:DUF1680 family protein